MHAHILHILFRRWLIFFSRKSSQPFFIEIDGERVDTSDKDINSEVKFETINQVWFMKIALDYAMSCRIDILKPAS